MATMLISAVALIGTPGCHRQHYRIDADRETYEIIAEKTRDPRWRLPSPDIEPNRRSRLADPSDPDHPPMPPDDPSAHRSMRVVDGKKGYSHWQDDGKLDAVEDPAWRQHLALADDGSLRLTPERALELALLHSREYQTELEDLYLAALALALNRFEFSMHWFARHATTYQHSGTSSTPTESNTVTGTSDLGFSRSLATGGQLLVDFANSFVWQFTGANTRTTSSSIAVDFVQPLLRRAGREVRLEPLTQAERSVLYEAREFARFRKQFYLNITTGAGGYLSLLLQVQNIRNLEANLASLERNLHEHEALAEAEIASSIQVDQVFQSYQAGRLALIQAKQNLENSLDAYKLTLGLPPNVPVQLDGALLAPFQLNDPALTTLEGELEQFLASYRELDEAPPLDRLKEGFVKLQAFHERLLSFLDQVDSELARWKDQTPAGRPGEQADLDRGKAAQQQLTERLAELRDDFADLKVEVYRESQTVREAKRKEAWESLQATARQEAQLLGELFVLQTQTRVYLIKLNPLDYAEPAAVRLALDQRLDLMNQRARVVDAWRQVRVAADGLESDLNLVAGANIGTEPGGNNPLDFSAAGSSYRVGFQFDGPLNRKAERNNYRSQLVNYQRARRSLMASEDRVEQAVRRDLRQLEADRLNFEITRQSLIIAARQVEQTRAQLAAPGAAGDSSRTQDVLDALNRLLQTKNSLIGIWVSFETGRTQLLLDLEALELDARGVYTDGHQHTPERPHEPTGGPGPRDAGPLERAEPALAEQPAITPAEYRREAAAGWRPSHRPAVGGVRSAPQRP